MLFLLADGDPVSAILTGQKGPMNTFLLFGLIIAGTVAFTWPQIKNFLRQQAEDVVGEIMQKPQAVPPTVAATAPTVIQPAPTTLFMDRPPLPPPTPVNEVIRQRLTDIKSACPKSSATQRLQWLEQGLPVERVMADYIQFLEGQLPVDSGAVTPGPISTQGKTA